MDEKTPLLPFIYISLGYHLSSDMNMMQSLSGDGLCIITSPINEEIQPNCWSCGKVVPTNSEEAGAHFCHEWNPTKQEAPHRPYLGNPAWQMYE